MNPLAYLNEHLSRVEKVFIAVFALAGVWFFFNGDAFFTANLAGANPANLLATGFVYYFVDPFGLFLLFLGYRFFGGLKGLLTIALLDISYDLMFFKGTGSFGAILSKNFTLFSGNFLGVDLNSALLLYLLPLTVIVLIALTNPTFFDYLFDLQKFD